MPDHQLFAGRIRSTTAHIHGCRVADEAPPAELLISVALGSTLGLHLVEEVAGGR